MSGQSPMPEASRRSGGEGRPAVGLLAAVDGVGVRESSWRLCHCPAGAQPWNHPPLASRPALAC
jgi:hypothetical protein